jgi:hypothetical protein
VRVYSNQENVTLYVNGKKVQTLQPDNYAICQFENVQLQKGKNIIKIEGQKGSDECIWILQ